MRNYILSILFMLMCAPTMSQDVTGYWTMKQSNADELLGKSDDNMIVYADLTSGALFLYYENIPNQYMISSGDGIFDYRSSSIYQGCTVLVGIYDLNGKLLDKSTVWLDCTQDGTVLHTRRTGKMSQPIGQEKVAKKIFKHLNEGSGYVRIVAPRYSNPDLDLKIACKKNSKFLEELTDN